MKVEADGDLHIALADITEGRARQRKRPTAYLVIIRNSLDCDGTARGICGGSWLLSASNRSRKTMRPPSSNQTPLLTAAYDVVKNGAALDLLRDLAAWGYAFCLVY